MSDGPFAFAGVVKFVTKEECIELLLCTNEVVCRIITGTADVAHGFI